MLFLLIQIIIVFYASISWSQQIAFPTAEGAGRFSVGGRGDGSTGYVCHVTSLTDSASQTGGQGSLLNGGPHRGGDLRYCVSQSGSRTVVFDKSGEVTLLDRLIIVNPNITIAGQTAPSNGVQIRDEPVVVTGDNVVIRHIRSRPGKLATDGSAVSDAFTITGVGAHDIMVDHSSFSWAVDENAGIWGSSDNITFQWTMIYEPLNCAGHDEGCHAKNFLAGALNGGRYTFHHNLVAHAPDRNPWFKNGDASLVNNLIYNWGGNRARVQGDDGVGRYNAIGNYFKQGPNASTGAPLGVYADAEYLSASGYYIEGNIDLVFRTSDAEPETDIITLEGLQQPARVMTPYSFEPVQATTAVIARDAVLANAGATKPVRDSVDAAIVQSVLDGSGDNTINTPSESVGGGYPSMPVVTRGASYDTDHDGLPDTWETDCSSVFGNLSPTVGGDANDIISGIDASVNGYSKLEVYLNAVAGDYGTDGVSTCAGLLSADTIGPVVEITAPTSSDTYATNTTPMTTIAGTATDAVGTTGITWANAATSGSGAGSGCAGETSCNWSVSSIALNEGSNVITITGTDAASNEGTDVITVTLDSTPPVRSNGSPSGELASGTTETSISLTTDETATCKYGTSAGVSYASQPNTFSITNSTSHSTSVTGLSDGNSYTYYVRCQDSLSNANTNDFSISFSIADASVVMLGQPSSLNTTHSSTVTALGSPSALSTTHSSVVTPMGSPSSLNTTHSSTVTVLGNPSGIGTP